MRRAGKTGAWRERAPALRDWPHLRRALPQLSRPAGGAPAKSLRRETSLGADRPHNDRLALSPKTTHFVLHALLIDDEAAARADLRAKLGVHAGVTVVGEAATLSAARALLARADYDLVFLDVQLLGGESFLLVPDVRPGTSLVFATAHDRYAARAFESNAVDYLLKPIDPARLAEAVRRAALAQAVNESRNNPAIPPVRVHLPASRMPIGPLATGGLIAASEHFDEVALTGDERVFLRQCIEAWEDSLPAAHVLRAPRALSARRPREICYERGTEPTRLFLATAPVSRARRWWRAVLARLGLGNPRQPRDRVNRKEQILCLDSIALFAVPPRQASWRSIRLHCHG